MADANVTNVVESEKENTIMDNKLIFNADGKLIGITDEEVKRLATLLGNSIEWCRCFPKATMVGTENYIRKWFASKAWIIALMAKDPDYNGDYEVVKMRCIERTVDKDVCTDFLGKMRDYATECKTPYVLNGHTYLQVIEELESINNKIFYAEKILDDFPIVDEFITTEKELLNTWQAEKTEFSRKHNNDELYYSDSNMYDRKEYDKIQNCRQVLENVKYNLTPTIDESMANFVNSRFPKFKAKEGQKTSRVVNKICNMLGLDTITYDWIASHGFSLYDFRDIDDRNKNAYNPLFAKFGDAINPFSKEKEIHISVHPIHAFFAQSWGTDWTSCHTPDKNDRHKYGENSGATYHGMYCSGPISYMFDSSSVTMYILGKDAVQKAEEMGEPSPRKEMRQMFHLGKQKFIQGRLYPFDQSDQHRNAEPEDYKQYREIMQEFLSGVWGVENKWKKNLRGNSYCEQYSSSQGTHYRDYTHYSNCNVSLLKGCTSSDKISIGSNPICPSCGRIHTTQDNLFCYACRNDDVKDPIPQFFDVVDFDPIGDMSGTEINEDIPMTHCAYHDEDEPFPETEMFYVQDYGYICRDALDSGDFSTCEECGDRYYNPDGDEGEYSERDDRWFCCRECAERNGYYYLDRYEDYIHEDDFEYSEIDDMDLMPSDDETVYAIYDEYDSETIALRDSCFEYDGNWYDRDLETFDHNSDSIPNFMAVEVYYEEYESDTYVRDEAENADDITELNGTFYYNEVLVETVDGDFMPEWETIEYNGEYYDEDECVWVEGIGDVPLEFTTEYNGDYYLTSECIWVDDDLVPINMSEMNEVA